MTARAKADPAVWVGVGFAVLVLILLGPAVLPRLVRLGASPDASREMVFTIPPGTADLIKAGGDPKLVPDEMVFTLGVKDVLVIHNQDASGHTFGPYWVASNNTLRVQFSRPEVYVGFCSVHPSSQVKIIVQSS